MGDYFSDFDEQSTNTPSKREGGGFSKEVFSEKISAKYRTFFVDVKENNHGFLIKISEKSRGGKKSTVMFDAEDLEPIITALQGAKNACEE